MDKYLNNSDACVIADFDGTLIKKVVNGKFVPSLISLLVHEKYLGIKGVEETKKIVAHYYPIELNHLLSPEEKNKAMLSWWQKSFEIMQKYKVTKEMIEEVCNSPMVQLRNGLTKFLNFLSINSIPLIIYSASGIGYDAIEYILKKNNLLTKNVTVCSNDLVFNKQGYFIKVKEPIIHAANKTGLTLIKNGYIKQMPDRKQCLLIGDSLDDIQMVKGIEFERVIKVVFADKKLPKFNELFDYVLPINSGFQKIQSLIT